MQLRSTRITAIIHASRIARQSSTGWTIFSSSNASHQTTQIVLSSSDSSYSVQPAVLNSAGISYTPI